MTKKAKHGGRRPNQTGRPKTGTAKGDQVCYFSQDILAYLAHLKATRGSHSPTLEALIRRSADFRQWEKLDAS